MNLDDEKFQEMRHRILKRKFQIARNQARYRSQEWLLTQDDYFAIWDSIPQSWLYSGKGSEDYNLSRIDMDEGWSLDNVHVIPRRQMLVNQGKYVSERNRR